MWEIGQNSFDVRRNLYCRNTTKDISSPTTTLQKRERRTLYGVPFLILSFLLRGRL